MKHKLYTITGIFTLIAIGIVAFLIYPLIMGINNDANEVAGMKASVASLQMQNNEIGNFEKSQPSYTPNLAAMGQSFIDPDNPVDFITFLENTAGSAGITPKVSLVSQPEEPNQKFISFQLSCTDTFPDVMAFIQKLENGPYAVQIENITLNSQDEDGGIKALPGNVDATFTINAIENP